MENKSNIIFLDFDGVLNCQQWYQDLKDKGLLSKIMGHQRDVDPWRVRMLNDLCKETNSVVVISSSWKYMGIKYCRGALLLAGCAFDVIDTTPNMEAGLPRGVEIKKWLEDNCLKLYGVHSHDFFKYVIIDDDGDMLLQQASHFFQTDPMSGLTPNICWRIKKFLTHKTF